MAQTMASNYSMVATRNMDDEIQSVCSRADDPVKSLDEMDVEDMRELLRRL